MANTDGELNIKTKIDTEGVEKNLNDLKTKLTKATGTNVVKGVVGLGAAFAGVSMAVKGAAKAINETTKAYEIQKKAEVQLEAAAKNNPYLNSKSVSALKDYASQLQKIGTIGDEVLIPQMAQLAAAGRTQEEIQNIMSAALDVSASGMMSFDAAVQSLNASLSGNVGTLGRQVAELKGLTEEELKNGKAIEIVSQKFKGIAEETAKATGSSEQLANAWGDLKEEIGASFEKPLSSVRRFFTELISGWTDAASARRKYNEAKEKIDEGTASATDYQTAIDTEQEALELTQQEIAATLELLNDREKLNKKIAESRGYYSEATAKSYLTGLQKRYEEQVKSVEKLNKLLKEQEEQERKVAQEAQAAADAEARKAEAAARNKTAQNIIDENQAALDKQLKQMEIDARLKGEEVDKQAVLNALMSSYIDLVTTSPLVTENNQFSKKRLAELEAYAAGIEKTDEKYNDLINTIKEFLGESGGDKLSDTIQAEIDALKEEQKQLAENSDAWKKYAEKIGELENLKTKVVKEETKQRAAEVTSEINNYMGQFADIVGQITDLVGKTQSAANDKALTEISEQYTDGLISYEQYCDKKTEIARKQAQDEYKLNMWNWSASILQATANIAEGVSKAIAKGGAEGFISGALVSAAGAAQIASIIAAKPTPPKFANGGIVGGSSFSGDNITARVNSGEMILNKAQQAQLWKTANGGGSGGIALKVDITNNMGDSARVSTQATAGGLRVTIDRLVNASMKEGRYNDSLAEVENNKRGVRYL